jgi:hypothetical protein
MSYGSFDEGLMLCLSMLKRPVYGIRQVEQKPGSKLVFFLVLICIEEIEQQNNKLSGD